MQTRMQMQEIVLVLLHMEDDMSALRAKEAGVLETYPR